MSKIYFYDELDTGRELNVLLLSHNVFWPELQRINHYYKNFNLTVYGGSTLYLERTKQPINYDFDLILFYSSNYYEKKELLKLKEIAFDISEEKKKRVTIGYSYIIPTKMVEKVKLVSFKDCVETEETTYGIQCFNPRDLLEMTLVAHDTLENQKKLIKK